MSGPLIAVLDQGSSATKAALVSPQGEVAASRVAVSTRRDGEVVEQDPREIWASVESVLGELERRGRNGHIDHIDHIDHIMALGLCAQRSSCLLWERSTGEPLTAVISWQDRRHAALAAALAGELGETVREQTGLFLSPHYAALKLRGLLDAEPGLRSRAEAGEVVAGTLDAWLVQRLTGTASTEPGQAGRTLLYDLASNAWSASLCQAFAIPPAALPPLSTSAGERGFWNGVPLVALLGDQQAALLGHGGWAPGVVAAHFGSGAFVLASTGAELRRHRGLLSAVIASRPGERRFQLEGTVQSAGTAIDWACERTGVRLEELEPEPLEPERLAVFVPAFVGLGAPWWKPRARARLLDLELTTTGEALVRAALVGVAQRVADNVEAMREAGVEIGGLRLSGGLAGRADFSRAVCELGRVPVELAEQESGLDGLARCVTAVLTGEPLDAPPPPAAHRQEPGWPEARWRETRAAWRAHLAGFADNSS